ncbi:MAG: hypothetical protein NT154_24740 [Verrucomicrobia bacterium]|nr:hypothetical protein [Verrucomicrobiota bacterium]
MRLHSRICGLADGLILLLIAVCGTCSAAQYVYDGKNQSIKVIYSTGREIAPRN